MSIKKEPAIADPSQYNYITKVAKKLKNTSVNICNILMHPNIYDVNIRGTELEFIIDDFEVFYEESEGCHIYIERHDGDNKEFPYKAYFRLFNNRFAILLDYEEVNKLRNLLNEEDYTDRVSKDIYSMTVGELVKKGYKIQISHHSEKSKQEAKEMLEEFEQIHDIKRNHSDSFNWLDMSDGNVDISVFFEYKEVN